MSQWTGFGEAELDSYIRVERKNGTSEFFHVVNGQNVPISAAQYEQATESEHGEIQNR